MPRKNNCTMRHCTNPVKYVESGLCKNCYQALWSWNKRTPTEMVRHQKKLRVYEARMESLTNITIGSFKKRKAQ